MGFRKWSLPVTPWRPALPSGDTQYSVRHPEVQPGSTNDEWDRATLANLDSTLNAWVDSVPTHRKFASPTYLPLECLKNAPFSQMGSLPSKHCLPRPIRDALHHVLFPANLRSPAFYRITGATSAGIFEFGDMHERREGVQSHYGDPGQ